MICETVANGGFIGPGRKWRIVPIDTVLGHQLIKRFSVIEGDPESAKVEFHQIYEIEKKDLTGHRLACLATFQLAIELEGTQTFLVPPTVVLKW